MLVAGVPGGGSASQASESERYGWERSIREPLALNRERPETW